MSRKHLKVPPDWIRTAAKEAADREDYFKASHLQIGIIDSWFRYYIRWGGVPIDEMRFIGYADKNATLGTLNKHLKSLKFSDSLIDKIDEFIEIRNKSTHDLQEYKTEEDLVDDLKKIWEKGNIIIAEFMKEKI